MLNCSTGVLTAGKITPEEFAEFVQELDEFLYPTKLSDGTPLPDDVAECYRRWQALEDRLERKGGRMMRAGRERLEMDAENLRLTYRALAGLCL